MVSRGIESYYKYIEDYFTAQNKSGTLTWIPPIRQTYAYKWCWSASKVNMGGHYSWIPNPTLGVPVAMGLGSGVEGLVPPSSCSHTHGNPFTRLSLRRRAFLISWKEVISMIKFHILDCCEFCEGEAYIYDCQDVDTQGEAYDGYRPWEMCHASGNQANDVHRMPTRSMGTRATLFFFPRGSVGTL